MINKNDFLLFEDGIGKVEFVDGDILRGWTLTQDGCVYVGGFNREKMTKISENEAKKLTKQYQKTHNINQFERLFPKEVD